MVRHRDGFSIYFMQGWLAGLPTLAEGGCEGCLLMAFAPVGLWWALATRAGGRDALVLSGFFGLVSLIVVMVCQKHRRGPCLSVRGGRLKYDAPDPKLFGSDNRRCGLDEVIGVEDGPTRPVIKLRGGREFLGGYDPIDVPGYHRVPAETRAWVVAAIRGACGI